MYDLEILSERHACCSGIQRTGREFARFESLRCQRQRRLVDKGKNKKNKTIRNYIRILGFRSRRRSSAECFRPVVQLHVHFGTTASKEYPATGIGMSKNIINFGHNKIFIISGWLRIRSPTIAPIRSLFSRRHVSCVDGRIRNGCLRLFEGTYIHLLKMFLE